MLIFCAKVKVLLSYLAEWRWRCCWNIRSICKGHTKVKNGIEVGNGSHTKAISTMKPLFEKLYFHLFEFWKNIYLWFSPGYCRHLPGFFKSQMAGSQNPLREQNSPHRHSRELWQESPVPKGLSNWQENLFNLLSISLRTWPSGMKASTGLSSDG